MEHFLQSLFSDLNQAMVLSPAMIDNAMPGFWAFWPQEPTFRRGIDSYLQPIVGGRAPIKKAGMPNLGYNKEQCAGTRIGVN